MNAVEVSLLYTKSVEGEKDNLVKASQLILCSQGKVLVSIWDSETFCVYWRRIKSYFMFQENVLFFFVVRTSGKLLTDNISSFSKESIRDLVQILAYRQCTEGNARFFSAKLALKTRDYYLQQPDSHVVLGVKYFNQKS